MGDGPLRIAGIASHNGTNLRHIDAACRAGDVDAELVVLVSNNGEASILDYAREHGIAWHHLSSRTHPDPDRLDQAIADVPASSTGRPRLPVRVHEAAGPERRWPPSATASSTSTPPCCRPTAARACTATGSTRRCWPRARRRPGPSVHLVDEEYDHGPVVLQYRVPVLPDDTLETLRDRVRACEPRLSLDVVGLVAGGEIDLDAVAREQPRRTLPGARAEPIGRKPDG